MSCIPSIASIYNRYSDSLFAYACHLGFNEDIALDAIHDVFYKLCIDQKFLENISNLKLYLFKSLKNRLIDIYRNHREEPFEEDVSENMSFRFDVTVEDELIREEDLREIRRKVEKVLNGLTDRQREIIYLRYIQEYGYEEIAELMQISVASCRNLLSKSINKLREYTLSVSNLLLFIGDLPSTD